MAKQEIAKIKVQVPGGQATPAPPVGTALGPHGVNIGQFVQQFNSFLIQAFKKHLGVGIVKHDILWSTSSRPEKTSFHILVKNHDFYFAKSAISVISIENSLSCINVI